MPVRVGQDSMSSGSPDLPPWREDAPIRGKRFRRLWRRVGVSWSNVVNPVTVEERNERAFYAEAVFQSISNAGALSFVAVFLVRLGAPSWLVGLYTSIPALIMLMFTLPAAAYVQGQQDLVRMVNRMRFLFRTGIGALALLPFLPAQIASYGLAAIRGLIAIPDATLVVGETTMIGKMTTPQRRTRMLSTRSAILGLFSAGVGLASGQWLDAVAYPWNYQILFFTAFLSGLGSVWALAKVKLPSGASAAVPRRERFGLRQMLPLLRGAPSFARYVGAAFIFRIGMYLPMALYPIYRVRVLGSSDSWIGVLYTVERGLNVLSYILLSRLASRPSVRRWLWLGCVGMAFYPLTMSLATSPEGLLLPSMIIGIISPSMNLFLTDTLLRVSPDEGRPTFVAANHFLSNITGLALPILGTLIADWSGIAVVLIAASGLRFVGGLSFAVLGVTSREEREPASGD